MILPPDPLALAAAARASLATYNEGLVPEPIVVVGGDDTSEIPDLRAGTAFAVKTSGSTTGTGKFVELSWEALLASIHATHEALGGPGTWLVSLPVNHVAGLQTVLRSVVAGVDPLPYRLGDDLPKQRCYLSLVPTQLGRVLADPGLIDSLTGIAAILVGGQATSAAMLDAARGAGLPIVTTYGMTETCGGCVYNGRPLGTVSIESVTPITITGPVVATGYAGGPSFDGTFTTADIGQWDGDTLTVLGRADDGVTTGGLTIFPRHLAELADRILSCASVALAVPDPTWGEALCLVTAKPVDDEALRATAKAKLGAEYSPKLVVDLATLGLADFPLTSSGKVDRRTLANIVGEHRGSRRLD